MPPQKWAVWFKWLGTQVVHLTHPFSSEFVHQIVKLEKLYLVELSSAALDGKTRTIAERLIPWFAGYTSLVQALPHYE